ELLDRWRTVTHGAGAHSEGPRDFGDVHVAFRIDRDAVRRGEVARRVGGPATVACEHGAMRVEDRHAPVAITRDLFALRRALALAPPELGEIEQPVASEDDVRRPLRGPLRQIGAVRSEHLDAVVLAVAHEDAAVAEDADAVRDLELPRSGARFAPGTDEPPV